MSAGLRQRGRGGAEGAERAVGGRSVTGRRPRRGWGAQDRARGLGHLGAGQVHSRGSAEHAGAPSASPAVRVRVSVRVCVGHTARVVAVALPGQRLFEPSWATRVPTVLPVHTHTGDSHACARPTTRPGPRVQTRVAGMCPQALRRVSGRVRAHDPTPEAPPAGGPCARGPPSSQRPPYSPPSLVPSASGLAPLSTPLPVEDQALKRAGR